MDKALQGFKPAGRLRGTELDDREVPSVRECDLLREDGQERPELGQDPVPVHPIPGAPLGPPLPAALASKEQSYRHREASREFEEETLRTRLTSKPGMWWMAG